jgi:glycosyltransferase involved in cell wall biosynthesis
MNTDGIQKRMLDGRPLRLALFSDSAPPVINGVSVSIEALMDGLRTRGHEVHLFATGYPVRPATNPYDHRFLGVLTKAAKDYPLAVPPFAIRRLEFERLDFDLVHTHTPFTVGYVGQRWARASGIPIVSTYHTHYDEYAHYAPVLKEEQVRKWIRLHTRKYYGAVDHVITPSEASLNWLRGHGVFTQATVIPTGIPAPQPLSREACRQQLGIKPDAEVIVTVGRLAREKSMDLTIQATAEVLRSRPNAELWIVGDGPDREDIEAVAKAQNLGSRIHFTGRVDREEVDLYYAVADVFAFASTTETQGLVVVEAMAYGLPAIVVKGGGAGLAVKNAVNGFLIEGRADAMTVAIEKVLSNELLRAELAEGARETAEEYSLETMVGNILDIYRGVLQTMHQEPMNV